MKNAISIPLVLLTIAFSTSAVAAPDAGVRTYVKLQERIVDRLRVSLVEVFLAGDRTRISLLVGNAFEACSNLDAAELVNGVKAKRRVRSQCERLNDALGSAGADAANGKVLLVLIAAELAAEQIDLPDSAAARLNAYRFRELTVSAKKGETL